MKIVYVDNYDSFATTIATYFELAGKKLRPDCKVPIFNSDSSISRIKTENPDLLLLGPGPNSPNEAGNYLELIDKFKNITPIFGVCLGFQSLMQYYGEDVGKLGEIIHGGASDVYHNQGSFFRGIKSPGEFARYNSLGVYNVPNDFVRLAYSLENEREVVMAAEHQTLPVGGVQFHPESILSTGDNKGMKLVENVLNEYVIGRNGNGR
jgi:para-aminobenzoate synthetase component II